MRSSGNALSNLRALVIIIVVAFHACLAYLDSAPVPSVPFDQPPYSWQAFPIVDAHRWLGFDVFCAWQDVSLMSLMFLLSGIFAADSVKRKGSSVYSSDRLRRIGIPFLLAVIFLSPLSFYPAYLVRTADASAADFWRQWLTLPFWPSGPEWFLWQLLIANLLSAALYAVAPGSVARLGKAASWASTRPLAFFAFIVVASAIAYVPPTLAFSPWQWDALGPFSVQLSRPLHYLVYFFAGFTLGCHGFDRGLLDRNGPLVRHWLAWFAAAIGGFALWAGFTSLTQSAWDKAGIAAQVLASLAFPLACATGGLCLLAVCLRFAAAVRLRIVDSLSANAYPIYLLHYAFVVWLQYALLSSGLFVAVKLVVVFAGALLMSWVLSLALRATFVARVTAVKRAMEPVPR